MAPPPGWLGEPVIAENEELVRAFGQLGRDQSLVVYAQPSAKPGRVGGAPPELLCVASLTPRKGHAVLFDALVLGAAAGYASIGASPPLLAAILGFGVAALLYLVTEDLLLEAHATSDTPAITATFFLGFLIPLVLAHL